MKFSFQKTLAVLASTIILALCVVACSTSDLTKDLTLDVGSDVLVNSFSVQINDVANESLIPPDATVTIEGRDKDKIFSILGSKSIPVVAGIIALATKKVDAPSASQTLEFTVVVNAPNYAESRKSYVLNGVENEELQANRIAMLNKTALPAGASTNNTSFASTAGSGTVKTVTFSSDLTNGKTEKADAKIYAGTKIFAKDGSEIVGEVKSSMVHFDSKNESSFEMFPGGLMPSSVKDAATGQDLGAGVIMPLSWYSLDMNVGDKTVDHFGKALDMSTNINLNTMNPFEGRKVQAGDEVTIMSRDKDGDQWVKESVATVQNINGQLRVNYKQSHLSFWCVTFFQKAQCYTDIKVISSLPNYNIGSACAVPCTYFNYTLVSATDINRVLARGSSNFGNGTSLFRGRISQGLSIRARVRLPNGSIITTDPFNPCVNPTINLSGKLPQPNSIAVSINVGSYCRGNINTRLVPTGILFFMDVDKPNDKWKPLVYVRNGKGCARGLIVGRRYDFAIALPSKDSKHTLDILSMTRCFNTTALKIPQGDTSVTVTSTFWEHNETYSVKKENNSQYSMNFPNVSVSDKICAEINSKYSIFFPDLKK
ncbi:MAG: hypothetical protein U5L45_01355 [Saprospiraceae bacterium]|nr:hypothetical protein [Saprospiraceae bacterium]